MNRAKLILSLVAVLLAMSCQPAAGGEPGQPHDAMAELNAIRRSHGLRPFIRDDGLTRGALHVAKWRADRLIKGHTGNDMAGLPRGVRADAAGCAAVSAFWGFMACCDDENWRYAGAATCRGPDGRFYHQLFVRN